MASGIGGAGRLIWLVGLLGAWISPNQVQAPALVRPEPAALTLAPGETASLDVLVEAVSDLYGFELRLAFDPAVVQVVDADADQPGLQAQPGGFLDPDRGFTVVNSVNNEAGTVEYAFTLLSPAEPVSGDGALLRLSLRAVAAGSSPLSLTAVLATQDGQALPAETQDGSLGVSDDPPPVDTRPPRADPTATATPTRVSTQPPPAITRPPRAGSPTLTRPAAGASSAANTGDSITGPAGAGRSRPSPTNTRGPVPELTQLAERTTAAPPAEATEAAVTVAEGASETIGEPTVALEVAGAGQEPARIGAEAAADSQQESQDRPAATWLIPTIILVAILAAFFLGRRFLGRPEEEAQ